MSDNTRFRPQRRPITNQTRTKSPGSTQKHLIMETHPSLLTSSPIHDQSIHESVDLPAINEHPTNIMGDNINSTNILDTNILQELNINPLSLFSSTLSPTQIHEITTAIIHL